MHRKLGYWETIKVLTHDLFAGSDTTVIHLHFKGNIKIDLLQQSLELSFIRHPLLRAVIDENSGGTYQFQIKLTWPEIPFTVIEQTEKDQAFALMEKEMAIQFPAEKYLWRITLLLDSQHNETHLLLAFHHAMSDAAAIFNFINETLINYSILETGKQPKVSILPLCEPQEKFLPKKIDWDQYLARATQYQATHGRGWKFMKNVPIQQRVTKVLRKKLPLSLIKKLEKICHEKNVSLNALLNAITLLTKQQLDQAHGYEGTICTWANMRSACEPKMTNEHFGYFVNFVATKHHVDPHSNVWNLAEDYYKQLRKRLPELTSFPGGFDKQKAMASYNMEKMADADNFLYDFALSYLAKLPLANQYGALELIDFNISVNLCSGFAGMVLEIFTFTENISFACMYTEPLLSRAWVENYMDRFEENLTQLGRNIS